MDDTTRAHEDTKAEEPETGRIGLSGKLLVLTIVFVMVSEVLIYLPSLANFRQNWLSDRVAAAQIATLVFEAGPEGMVPAELERRLLANVGAVAVAIGTGETRRLIAVEDAPSEVQAVFDLREHSFADSIVDALGVMAAPRNRMIRVVAEAPMRGDFIELIMSEAPLKRAMYAFSRNILLLSLIISAITAGLVYLTLNRMFVRPMRSITDAMMRFRAGPEDPDRIVRPSGRGDEIGTAERELARMQTDLRDTLRERRRLAALGLAVNKINHDLRNLLAGMSMATDRIGAIDDPTVQRFAPRMMQTLDRAIRFCETTLKYGRAGEAPPDRRRFALRPLVEDAGETLGLTGEGPLRFVVAVDPHVEIDADPEQLMRIVMNLVRNAVQAIESVEREEGEPAAGEIRVRARREGTVVMIEVSDTGPGVSDVAKAKLFEAFQGSTKADGSGLGLAIAVELAEAHNGRIQLVEGTLGATFSVAVPDRVRELRRREKVRRQA